MKATTISIAQSAKVTSAILRAYATHLKEKLAMIEQNLEAVTKGATTMLAGAETNNHYDTAESEEEAPPANTTQELREDQGW